MAKKKKNSKNVSTESDVTLNESINEVVEKVNDDLAESSDESLVKSDCDTIINETPEKAEEEKQEESITSDGEETELIVENTMCKEEDEMAREKSEIKDSVTNSNSEKIKDLLSYSRKLKSKKKSENDKELLECMASDDMKIVASLLMEIREKNDKEMKFARVQMGIAVFTSCLALFVVICMAIGVASIIPQVETVVVQANEIIGQANEIIAQTNGILKDVSPVINNLNDVTTELAEADITGMLSNVDSLVVSSEQNMSEALKTITDIDIASLNQAISDLNAVVAPLSKMFSR